MIIFKISWFPQVGTKSTIILFHITSFSSFNEILQKRIIDANFVFVTTDYVRCDEQGKAGARFVEWLCKNSIKTRLRQKVCKAFTEI